MTEHGAKDAIVEIRIPGRGDARAEAPIERIERIFGMSGDVLDGRKGDGRVVDLTLQRRGLLRVHERVEAERAPLVVEEHDLLSVRRIGRHVQRIAQAVSKREGRLDVPAIAEIKIVLGENRVNVNRHADRVYAEGWKG